MPIERAENEIRGFPTTRYVGRQETVVGWDGSPEADTALQWALRRAENELGAIVLVDIEDDVSSVPGEVPTEQMLADRRRSAETEAERLRAQYSELEVNAVIGVGDRLEQLLRFSSPDNVLAVGTRRRRRPHFRYQWSLGARLAAAARGAVAIVPEVAGPQGTDVVVGIDGTDVSMKAARFAAREARRLKQPLVVVHAWLDPIVSYADLQLEGPILAELEGEHRSLLEQAVHSVRTSNPDLEIRSVLTREEAAPALKTASSSAALLVVGAKQTRGIGRLLLGSVSHALVLDISVPTIVVAPECVV